MFGRKTRAKLEDELREVRAEAAQHNREKQAALKRLSDYYAGARSECVFGEHCGRCEHGMLHPGVVYTTPEGRPITEFKYTCDPAVPCKSFSRIAQKLKDKESEESK